MEYSHIRFIGYALPTSPANLDYITLSGSVLEAGSYLAHPDTNTDIEYRVQILKNAVDAAAAKLPAGEVGVINVFVAPEFYFHGIKGPYIHSGSEDDPLTYLIQKLEEVFISANYANWTFIFGSIVTTAVLNEQQMLTSNSAVIRNGIAEGLYLAYTKAVGPLQDIIADMISDFIRSCHTYPCCVVRNRTVVISNIGITTAAQPGKNATAAHTMTVEKYFVSSVDFLFHDLLGKLTITEQMIAYLPIDISGGDLKATPNDPFAIFSQSQVSTGGPIGPSAMNYGVEICLDHLDMRLRQNINNKPPLFEGIHVQVIPSCGMQITAGSIAAQPNGFVFNCDGSYQIGSKAFGQEVIGDVNCLYAVYTYAANDNYGAHTQLARVQSAANGINPFHNTNAVCQQLDDSNIDVISISSTPSFFETCFGGGAGEVHIYGLNSPYIIYP